jgi:hypothetical protein
VLGPAQLPVEGFNFFALILSFFHTAPVTAPWR